jgi:hypothetical protein
MNYTAMYVHIHIKKHILIYVHYIGDKSTWFIFFPHPTLETTGQNDKIVKLQHIRSCILLSSSGRKWENLRVCPPSPAELALDLDD